MPGIVNPPPVVGPLVEAVELLGKPGIAKPPGGSAGGAAPAAKFGGGSAEVLGGMPATV
jgi:hypothetical protein